MHQVTSILRPTWHPQTIKVTIPAQVHIADPLDHHVQQPAARHDRRPAQLAQALAARRDLTQAPGVRHDLTQAALHVQPVRLVQLPGPEQQEPQAEQAMPQGLTTVLPAQVAVLAMAKVAAAVVVVDAVTRHRRAALNLLKTIPSRKRRPSNLKAPSLPCLPAPCSA